MYKYANVGHCSATSDKREARSEKRQAFTCDMNDGNRDDIWCDGHQRDGHPHDGHQRDGNDALHTPFWFSMH